MTEAGGRQMALTLLWLVCTGESGEMATELAKQGGCTFGYEITGKRPDWNFRLLIGPSSTHPFRHLIQTDIKTVGTA